MQNYEFYYKIIAQKMVLFLLSSKEFKKNHEKTDTSIIQLLNFKEILVNFFMKIVRNSYKSLFNNIPSNKLYCFTYKIL